MLHNLDRRLRDDLARKERSIARNGPSRIDRRAAEEVTQIGRAIDVGHAPPDLPDLIDDIEDDVKTTIDVLPAEVRFAMAEDEPGDLRPALAPVGARRVGPDDVQAGELRTALYRQPTLVRPVEVALTIVRDEVDDAPTVIDRLPTVEPSDAADAADPEAAPALDPRAPAWRVTGQADELHFATERRSRIVIGSMRSCDWVLDHPAVRAVHCELVYEDGWFLSARAPVRFLGLDVQGWTPVASGDVIGIGGAALRLEFASLDDANALVDAPAEDEVVADAPAPIAAPAPIPAPIADAKSAAEDAVFRLPEAEDATAARAVSAGSSNKRAVLGIVLLAALGGLYVTQRSAKSAPRRPAAPAAAAKAEPAATPPAPVRPPVTLAEPALATRAPDGVAALLDGNHRAALLAYRRVAAEGGGEAADIFVRALESRLAAPCRRAGRPTKECMP
jgi:hypothetical protein